MMKDVFCQCCGKEINPYDKVIQICYGDAGWTAHPHFRLFNKQCDVFHQFCDVAIRGGE